MNEKTRYAAIKIMSDLRDLNLTSQELSEALTLAWCGVNVAAYKIYENAIIAKKTDAVEGLNWEEFLRLSIEQIKLRCKIMRAEMG
jgi:hypothetical protein